MVIIIPLAFCQDDGSGNEMFVLSREGCAVAGAVRLAGKGDIWLVVQSLAGDLGGPAGCPVVGLLSLLVSAAWPPGFLLVGLELFRAPQNDRRSHGVCRGKRAGKPNLGLIGRDVTHATPLYSLSKVGNPTLFQPQHPESPRQCGIKSKSCFPELFFLVRAKKQGRTLQLCHASCHLL